MCLADILYSFDCFYNFIVCANISKSNCNCNLYNNVTDYVRLRDKTKGIWHRTHRELHCSWSGLASSENSTCSEPNPGYLYAMNVSIPTDTLSHTIHWGSLPPPVIRWSSFRRYDIKSYVSVTLSLLQDASRPWLGAGCGKFEIGLRDYSSDWETTSLTNWLTNRLAGKYL